MRPSHNSAPPLPLRSAQALPRLGGFTLIELMVTLVVIAVLAGIAGPQLAAFIQNSRLSSAANLLQADLQATRREAVKRNMSVLMCPVGSSSTPTVCGTAWTSGWMVCYRTGSTSSDFDRCDSGTGTNANPIITRGATESSLTLTGLPTTAPFVLFNADGTQSLRSSPAALSFTVTGSWTGSKTYTFTVPATGNVTMRVS